MRFLCFSFLSPPSPDAESACMARFLSSLVSAGHTVKLITLDYSQLDGRLTDDVVVQLLDHRILVERMPMRKISTVRRLLTRLRYGLFVSDTEYISWGIERVRADLRAHPGTVLITRSAWPTSNLVGWYCRKLASRWVAHFSDPFPSYAKMKLSDCWRYPSAYFWMYRVLRDASLVTVTCHNAIKYFNNITRSRFSKKFHLTYHIGFPRLKSVGYAIERSDGVKTIAHVGAAFKGRPVAKFAELISRIEGVRFCQFGNVCCSDLRQIMAPVRIESPGMATDAMASADAILVCDLDSGFGYTPYLPSKFAYALALGRPIFCLTTPDSEMAAWSKRVKGVYFIDMHTMEFAQGLMQDLIEERLCGPSQEEVIAFYPQDVADKFLERVNAIMGE